MSDLIFWIPAVLCFLAGFISIALSVAGVFRFRFVLNRMQSAAMIDTFGLLFLVLGLILLSRDMAYIPKLILIIVFQWIGSPIASHMVGRMEIRTEKNLAGHMRLHDLRKNGAEEEHASDSPDTENTEKEDRA